MAQPANTTVNSKIIKARPEQLYDALTNPEALAVWLAPGDMTSRIHHFEGWVGGGYEMSLYYPDPETGSPGKTAAGEDRFRAKFTELTPFSKVVQTVEFVSDDPAFGGEMTMEVSLEPVPEGTKVTFLFSNIPSGIRPEDNEAGTEQSLHKLALYVAQQ